MCICVQKLSHGEFLDKSFSILRCSLSFASRMNKAKLGQPCLRSNNFRFIIQRDESGIMLQNLCSNLHWQKTFNLYFSFQILAIVDRFFKVKYLKELKGKIMWKLTVNSSWNFSKGEPAFFPSFLSSFINSFSFSLSQFYSKSALLFWLSSHFLHYST